MVKSQPANAGDTRDLGSIPGLGRSPGVGNGNPLQYSCLGNRMYRGVWQAKDHGVAKSWTECINNNNYSVIYCGLGGLCLCGDIPV